MRIAGTRLEVLCLALALLGAPIGASALPFSNVFVFGDSLSDSGNVAIASGGAVQPVPFGGLIPGAAYASGRFSNGPVWVENFAGALGNSALPALAGGTNFAFGGARIGTPPLGPPVGIPTLFDQAAGFLAGGVTPSDALYVVWGGGNDARDAAQKKNGGDDAGASTDVQAAAGNLAAIVGALASSGATHFLVPTAPNLGLTPEALLGDPDLPADSTAISQEFNAALDLALAPLVSNPLLDIMRLDAFQILSDVVADPAAFGLANVTDPCVNLNTVCGNPDDFLFYDGIHPTAAGHRILAQFALAAVPEPGTLVLVAVGLAALRRSASRRALS